MAKYYKIKNIKIQVKMSDHIRIDFLLDEFKKLIYSKIAGEFQLKFNKINLETIDIVITNFYVKQTNPLEVKVDINYFAKHVSSLISHVDKNKAIGCCYSALYELVNEEKYRNIKI